MSENMVATKESQVSRKATQLDEAISLLNETALRVRDRLTPVLRPATQEAVNTKPTQPENLVDLAQNLEIKRERISYIQQELMELLSRLEL